MKISVKDIVVISENFEKLLKGLELMKGHEACIFEALSKLAQDNSEFFETMTSYADSTWGVFYKLYYWKEDDVIEKRSLEVLSERLKAYSELLNKEGGRELLELLLGCKVED